MSSVSPNIQEAGEQPSAPQKNPWFIKTVPHVVVVSTLLEMIFIRSWVNVIMVLLWIWFGNEIQKDMIVVRKESYFIYSFILVFSLASLSFLNILNKLKIGLQLFCRPFLYKEKKGEHSP